MAPVSGAGAANLGDPGRLRRNLGPEAGAQAAIAGLTRVDWCLEVVADGQNAEQENPAQEIVTRALGRRPRADEGPAPRAMAPRLDHAGWGEKAPHARRWVGKGGDGCA